MAMMRPLMWLVAAAGMLCLAAPAQAQYYQPFLDPQFFGIPDLQFFAPAEIEDYSGLQPPNTGFYFEYERLCMAVTRPENEPSVFSDTKLDTTWGNRYEMGYMTQEDVGWQLLFWNLNGPNANFVNAENVNFIDLAAGGTVVALDYFGNAITSLNEGEFSSLELNRVWRRKEFHNGSILELLLGFRVMNFSDKYIRQTTQKLELTPPNNAAWSVLVNTNQSEFENRMYGGQFGGRWFKQQGHWLLSAETRFFALANLQVLTNKAQQLAFDADPVDNVLIRLAVLPEFTESRTYSYAEQFVWGGELRVEAAYELTRDISLKAGMMYVNLGRGIGRGPTIADNNQDLGMIGAAFGLTINR